MKTFSGTESKIENIKNISLCHFNPMKINYNLLYSKRWSPFLATIYPAHFNTSYIFVFPYCYLVNSSKYLSFSSFFSKTDVSKEFLSLSFIRYTFFSLKILNSFSRIFNLFCCYLSCDFDLCFYDSKTKTINY